MFYEQLRSFTQNSKSWDYVIDRRVPITHGPLPFRIISRVFVQLKVPALTPHAIQNLKLEDFIFFQRL